MRVLLLILCGAVLVVAQMLQGIVAGNSADSTQAATPSDSPGAGTYGSTQSVTLSTATGSATICYTIDGSTPGAATPGTCNSSPTTTYSGAISVSATTTIKAIATKSGLTNSNVLTSTYTISAAPTYVSVASTGANSAATSTGLTVSTSTGDTMLVFASWENSCILGSTISSTQGDVFTAIPPGPSVTGSAMSVRVTAGGSGYTSPTATSSGGNFSVQPTLNATASGGALSTIAVAGGGSGAHSLPLATISIGGGSGGAAVFQSFGFPNAYDCHAAWIAYNVTGNASNTITVSTSATSVTYRALQVWRFTNVTGIEALANGVPASATNVVTGSTLTTTHANSTVVCSARGESTSNAWTVGNIAGSTATKPAGATPSGNLMSGQYRDLTSTISNQAGNMTLGSSTVGTSILCVSLY